MMALKTRGIDSETESEQDNVRQLTTRRLLKNEGHLAPISCHLPIPLQLFVLLKFMVAWGVGRDVHGFPFLSPCRLCTAKLWLMAGESWRCHCGWGWIGQ